MLNHGIARLLAALTAVATPGITSAATYCVDDAEAFQMALSLARLSSADDVIRLEAGRYEATDDVGFIYSPIYNLGGGDLDISGGWTNDCGIRFPGLRSTIDGDLQRPGLTILGNFFPTNLVRIRYMQFIRGVSSNEQQAGGLTVSEGGADIEIDSNRFADNTSTHPTRGLSGGLYVKASNTVFVRNNVFVSNDADTTAAQSAGAAYLDCGVQALAQGGRLINNTVVGNTADAGAAGDIGGIRLDGNCNWEIANNILWDNAGIDLALNSENAVLRYNDIADRGGSEDPATDTGNVSVDPQFVSTTSPRLKRSSSLIDAGLNTPIGGLVTPSFDGGPRLIGPRVDIGAYELDVLFTSSFDSGFGATSTTTETPAIAVESYIASQQRSTVGSR